MPLPTPMADEGHDEFIERCMGDENVQQDAEDNDQALAICESLWDERSTDMQKERRFIPLAGVEVRAVTDDDGEVQGIAGEGAVIGRRTIIAPGTDWEFEEEILPGAFDDVVDDDIVIEYNHDPNYVLGRTSAGTATVSADDSAFRYSVPEVPKSRADVLEAVSLGNVRGSSFSFAIGGDEDEEWIRPQDREDGGRIPLRRIRRFRKVFDTGPVTHPAYEETSVSARATERATKLSAAERRNVEEAAETETEPTETEEIEAEVEVVDNVTPRRRLLQQTKRRVILDGVKQRE